MPRNLLMIPLKMIVKGRMEIYLKVHQRTTQDQIHLDFNCHRLKIYWRGMPRMKERSYNWIRLLKKQLDASIEDPDHNRKDPKNIMNGHKEVLDKVRHCIKNLNSAKIYRKLEAFQIHYRIHISAKIKCYYLDRT